MKVFPIYNKQEMIMNFESQARGGTNQSSARLELGLDAKKALILGSKLGSGSKGLGSSSIQFWKFRLGPTYRAVGLMVRSRIDVQISGMNTWDIRCSKLVSEFL